MTRRALAVVTGGMLCLQACGQVTPPDDSGSGGSETGGAASGGAAPGGVASSGGRHGSGGADCAALDEGACTESVGCQPYTGYPVQELEACYDGSAVEFHGCRVPGCPASWTIGRDTEGQAWIFHGGCIPPRWENEGSSGIYPCADGGAGGQGSEAP